MCYNSMYFTKKLDLNKKKFIVTPVLILTQGEYLVEIVKFSVS